MPLENRGTVLYDSSDAEVGTGANPLRIDPTGTTEQPVSQGTAAAVAGAPLRFGSAPISLTGPPKSAARGQRFSDRA